MKSETTEPISPITSEHDTGSPIGTSDTSATAEKLHPVSRRDSIRFRLASLVLACVLPVWIAAGSLVYYNYQSKRALTEQRMLETARALAMVVDRELANMQGSLSVFATTPSLASGDLHAFYRQARAAMEAHPGADVIVSDATGQELIHTFLPFGASLPKRAVPETVHQIYEAGKPVITGVYQGAGTRRLQIAVDVPVFRKGRVVYDLAMITSANRFATVLLQQHLPPEWVGVIFDSNQVIVARTRLADKFVGRKARPILAQRIRATAEGAAELTNFEGIASFNSFSRSATSGWTVMIGVPKAIMMAEIWRWLWWAITGTALLSLAGIALALPVGRSVERIESRSRRLGAIVESSDDAIIGYRFDGIIESWNRGAERLLGYSTPEILGRHISILIPDDQLKGFPDRLRRLRDGEVVEQYSTTRKHKNGSPIPVALKISPTLDRLGTIVGGSAIVRDITERKRADEALRESEERFRSMFEHAAVGMQQLANDGRLLVVNQAMCRMLGYSESELIGRTVVELTYPDDLARDLALREPMLRGERDSYAVEKRYVHRDGSQVWVDATSSVVKDVSGRPLYRVAIVQNITERKQAEQQLQATANRLKAILDNAPVGVDVVDRHGNIVETNAAYQRITGYSRDELIGMNFKNFTHPEDLSRNLELFDDIAATQAYTLEKRYIRKDGRPIWVRLIGSTLSDDQRIGIVEDITESKQAQEALGESERFLRTVIDLVPHLIFVKDQDSRYLLVNRACAEAYGITPLQMVGRYTSELVSNPDYAEAFIKADREVIESGKPKFIAEEPIRDASGGVRLHQTNKVPFVSSATGKTALIGVSVDITDYKRAQQALAESEERLRTIVELAPDGIFVVSDQGRFLEVNQAACKQLGYTCDQLLQLKIFNIISPRFAQRVSARLRGEVASGSYETAHIRADGVEIPVELSVTKIMFRGQPAFIGITRDTSDRKRAEEQRELLEQQLRQAQKMEAVGRLAGGIAHDFNNLLMVIQSYAEIMQDSLAVHDRLHRYTQEIMKAADRAASLTRQMLAFSRKQILSPVVLDLNAVIDETAKMLKRLIGEDIEFRVSAAESLWPVKADSDQVVQVLMNLCVNARDAMPQGGTLTIATGNASIENAIAGQEYVSPGDYVWLSVTDTGTGISKDVQGRIFDPFFTTKEVGKGTGLGLATVYGIVKQSGGYVWVDSEPGQGACFTIYLPRVKRTIAPDASTKPEERPRGTETILVAEDEEALREAACDYLGSLGYTALAAGSGKEALSVASQHVGPIDLLITDVVMPGGMSGRELAQMLASLRPHLKTIFMSGYTDDAVLRHGIQELAATFLQKPFSLGTLAHKVHDMLERTETVS